MTQFDCGRYRLDLSYPRIMGVLNVTPDSFSDGGRHNALEDAVKHAEMMLEQGADIIDIGGESTRPGAQPATLDEERRRVLPVLERLKGKLDVPISIDTQKPALMREAIAAGADMINDVSGFRSGESVEAVADSDVGLCVMHMQGEPRSMQAAPAYSNVVSEVAHFLGARRDALLTAGVKLSRIVLDPGFGFGKSLEHNLLLLKDLQALSGLSGTGSPLLVGISRKSMIGQLLSVEVDQRMVGSVAAALIAVERGARIVRVHDVLETKQALSIWTAVVNSGHIMNKE